MPTTEEVRAAAATVFDPEIPVNIVDLGLIYTIEVTDGKADILMSLTSEHCPAAVQIPSQIKDAVEALEGIEAAEVTVTFDPPWGPHLISDAGREVLGIPDPEPDAGDDGGDPA